MSGGGDAVPDPDHRWSAKDRALDLLAMAASIALAVISVPDLRREAGLDQSGVVGYLALAILGCLTLYVRREHPVVVAAVVTTLSALTWLGGGAVLVAIFTLASRRGWRWGLAAVLWQFLAELWYVSIGPGSTPVSVLLLFNLLLLTPLVIVGDLIGRRRAALNALQGEILAARLQAAAQADQVRQEERERIALEVHDAVGHRLAMVSLRASALEVREDLSGPEIRDSVRSIRESSHSGLQELRDLLGLLRAEDGVPAELGLGSIDRLADQAREAGLQLDLANQLPPTVVSPLVGRTIYRMVQEGLTNAAKHAPGAPVSVSLTQAEGGELQVKVANPLPRSNFLDVPAGKLPGGGTGLAGLTERVSLVEGRLQYGLRQRGAEIFFELQAWFPCRA